MNAVSLGVAAVTLGVTVDVAVLVVALRLARVRAGFARAIVAIAFVRALGAALAIAAGALWPPALPVLLVCVSLGAGVIAIQRLFGADARTSAGVALSHQLAMVAIVALAGALVSLL